MSHITPEQMNQLLSMAAARMHTTPEALKEALQQKGLQGTLSPQDAARAHAVLQDKDALTALLADPSVRQLLGQLLG